MSLFKNLLSMSAVIVLSLILTSCASVNSGSSRLTATTPKEEAFRKELKKELSTVNVTVEISAAELNDNLNRVLPRELYKGSTKTSGVATKVVKNGPVTVSVADNYLNITLPVSMALSYGIFESPALNTKLKFRVTAKVTPDWKIDSEIYYTGLTDALADEVRIGPVAIKPRSLVEGVIQPLQAALSNQVRKKLNEKFSLREQVAKAWSEAQKPILLDRNYSAWVVMTPREVVLYPLYAQHNQVKVTVGLVSFAEVVVGPQPPARTPVPLPNLKLASGADRRFRVALNTDLFYRDLLKIAAPLLLNKEFGQDGKSVVLKELDIYGNGERIMVKVATAGTVDGVFYLTCKPLFDPRSNRFSVTDLDFDVESKSLLLRTADWFLHGAFKKAIEEKLNLDLTPQLSQAREMARNSLARVKLAENTFLTGSVQEMRINDLMVQREKLSLGVYLEGETAIVFH